MKLSKLIRELDNPKKYANATNLKDYKALPKKERERWGFWYKLPKAYTVGGGSFEPFFKKEYPIQYRVRKFFWDIDVWIGSKKLMLEQDILPKFFPKNKWARKSIPKHYELHQTLIQNFCVGALDNYINSHHFKMVDWEAEERFRKIYIEIMAVHTFFFKELPNRENEENKIFNLLYPKEEEKNDKDFFEDWLENGLKEDKGKDKHYRLLLYLHQQETEELIEKNLKKIIELSPNFY
jgi:hypothetical protein